MAELKTTYMGIELRNPVVVGACSLSKKIETIQRIEEAGAGALVIKSLFEEQIQLERQKYTEELSQYDNQFSEALSMFPKLEHAGPRDFLLWVEAAKKSVKMPLIASLNATEEDVWVEYARQLSMTGVDGIELNFYSLPLDVSMAAAEVEKRELDTLARIRDAVTGPIAVKMHSQYTSLPHIASAFDSHGANALVFFNRFFEPDIDIESEKEVANLVLSGPDESLRALRWIAILSDKLDADIAASTGILDAKDAIKMLLAGAAAVQVVSALYKNGIDHIGTLLKELNAWMDRKGYKSIADFQGRISKSRVRNPWAYERGQYIKLLLGFD